MSKVIRVTVDHDKNEVFINILTDHKENVLALECKDTINTRMILNELLNSIDFNNEELLELAEVIDGQYTTIDKW